jgi:hypothetical protein
MTYHTIYNFNSKSCNIRSTLENMYRNKYKEFLNFENIHILLDIYNNIKKYYDILPIFGVNDRKSPFIQDFYNYIDSDYTFLYEYLSFIKNEIKPLFNDEKYIVIQKTPNIRFHLPNCSNIGKRETDEFIDLIGVHTDNEFGHHPEELNVIFPITRMFDTNSIYYEDYPKSNQRLDDFKSLNINENNFSINKFNSCLHYNKINKTTHTRVSLDFRIIPYSKFYKEENKMSATNKIKFEIGDYYMLL